jgi:hypothetical protein
MKSQRCEKHAAATADPPAIRRRAAALRPTVGHPLTIVGLLAALIVATLSVAYPASAQAPSRVALIIGNGAYPNPLPSTQADAGAMTATMRAIGFDVAAANDVRLADFGRTMRAFLDKAAAVGPQGIVFFYYAGIATQFENQNYLVPVDGRIASANDVPAQALRLGDLLSELAKVPAAARIVVLDASREHGYGRGTPQPVMPGLAAMQPTPGILVAFAAAPGQTVPDFAGQYSLYTSTLVTLMRQGGSDLDQLFKTASTQVSQQTKGQQTPWIGSGLSSGVAQAAPPAAAPAQAAPPAASPAPAASAQDGPCVYYKVNTSLLNVSKDPGGNIYNDALIDGDSVCVTRKANANGTEWGFIAYKLEGPNGRTPVEGWSAVQYLQQISEAVARTPAAPRAPAPAARPATAGQAPATARPAATVRPEDILRFDQPIPFGPVPVNGHSLKEMIDNTPLFSPVEGLEESLWKKKCTSCHEWNQARLCQQGATYVEAPRNVLRVPHPFGGALKLEMMRWAKSGCP